MVKARHDSISVIEDDHISPISVLRSTPHDCIERRADGCALFLGKIYPLMKVLLPGEGLRLLSERQRHPPSWQGILCLFRCPRPDALPPGVIRRRMGQGAL